MFQALQSLPIPFLLLLATTLEVSGDAVVRLVFHTVPELPVWLGGALVIAGGLMITFWRTA